MEAKKVEKRGKHQKEKHAPPAKERYDEGHPTISIRISNATREKLRKYKKNDMTWVDVIMTLVGKAEEEVVKEEIKDIIMKEAEENEKLNKELEEYLTKDSKLTSEMSKKQDEILQKAEKIHTDFQSRVERIEGFLNAKFPDWGNYTLWWEFNKIGQE